MNGLGEDVYIDRSAALDELTAESQRLGLYGDAPDNAVEAMVEAAAKAAADHYYADRGLGWRHTSEPERDLFRGEARAALESLGVDLAVLADLKAGNATVVRMNYGCHCDLAPGDEPDTCVIDDGRRDDCLYAKKCETKEECPEWRQYSSAPKTPEE